MSEEQSLAVIDDLDRYLVQAGDSVPALLALDVLASAAKNYTLNHEQKRKAQLAKLKIARRGGEVLAGMAERGERRTVRTARSNRTPRLDQLGLTLSRSQRWQEVWHMTPASFDARLRAIENEDADADLTGDTARDSGSGDFEWFTPVEYIEAARRVMGGIDLDPASTEAANEVVNALSFYTAEDNGLSQPWAGRVWMNPPYTAKLVWAFCERLADEFAEGNVAQACVILNNTTETGWFQRLAEVASGLCLPARRVRFWHPAKPDMDGPKQGQAVVYLGPNIKAFCTEFRAFGVTAVFM